MTPVSEVQTEVLSEEMLLSKYGDAFARTISGELEADMEAERLTQVMVALMHTQHYRGNQYTAPKLNKLTGGISIEAVKDEDGRDLFKSVYNVYKADCDKFIGAVSSHAPKAVAVPDDEEDEESVRQATEANGHLRDFQRKINPDNIQGELGENAWVTGPTFALASYQANGYKYGYTMEPVIETVEVPGPLGVPMPTPQVVDMKKYPKGDVELHLANILYVTIPFHTKSLEDTDRLRFEYMEDKHVLMGLYRDQLKDERGNWMFDSGSVSGGSQETMEAQQMAISPSGGAQDDWKRNKWRYTRWWLTPALYSLIAPEIAEKLEDQFPDGLCVALVNGHCVDVKHERLTDKWSVCRVSKGGPIIREPLGAQVIPIQKDLNNFFNMAKEIILRTIVKIAIDSQAFDREKLKSSDPVIYEYVPVESGPGQSIKDLFEAFPTAKMPDGLERLAQVMIALRREIGGVTEALFGGGQPANTYRAEKQRRDQSMMQFAPFFDCTRDFFRQTYRNLIMQRARYGSGTVRVPGENGEGAIDVDAAMLSEGGWHIEVEEGIPVSITEETDRAMWMMAESGDPDLPSKMGLIDNFQSTYEGQVAVPSAKFKRMVGVTGIPARGEDVRKKVHKIIQRLLKEPPIRDIDMMTGQEMVQPAIMPEDLVDDHLLIVQLVRQWCNSAAGIREAERNPEGYEHVKAYMKAQQDAADALMNPPMPMGPDGAPMAPAPPQGEEPAPEPQGEAFNTQPPPLA